MRRATRSTAPRTVTRARAGHSPAQYDLVVLDILLPGRDGLEVLTAIRGRDRHMPVILLSALGEIEDRVRGLDRGATDYVVKPFSMEELLARVRAHLRKPHQETADVLEVGDLRLDLRTRRCERAGAEVQLTAREFELLTYLMRHPGQVLSREQILNAVWGFDYEPGTNVLEVYVSYLRSKLGVEDSGPDRDRARRRLPAGGERCLEASVDCACSWRWSISAVSVAVLAASFFALRKDTGDAPARPHRRRARRPVVGVRRMRCTRARHDGPEDARAPRRSGSSPRRPTTLARASSWCRSRAARPSRTNRRSIGREEERERNQDRPEELGESRLLGAAAGLATVSGQETGRLRVLSEPIVDGRGRRLGTFRVADPLQPVEDAQAELSDAFIVVGLVALLISIAVAGWRRRW